MDPQTASYYRAILFTDSQDTRPLPPSLVLLHAWAVKRCQALGISSTIAKASALAVAMQWMGSTKEGRAFARDNTSLGELFCDDDDSDSEPVGTSVVEWDGVQLETKVVVLIDKKPTIGEYMGLRSSRVDVRIAGERKSFKRNEVKLAGA